ncbi:hypothetical protein [Tenacibaculum finnmarkense]|uniref:hypothetical protein n=1 Tax=Tenacibaculum finnmarkense TaxID=2781243 RepID=UPI001E2A4A48|nr:hypothetical protein [Tenacibaculum finnmarkense]MCD8410676.1 hypothetical protein [Tenacibaculum finnmarkense genomovar ulcerans]
MKKNSITILGKGLEALNKIMTPENLAKFKDFSKKTVKTINDFGHKIDEYSDKIKENTEKYCTVLEVDELNMQSLKAIIDEHGAKNFHFVVLLKGKFDEQRDKRVYFLQKLDENKKPITNQNEIFCIYTDLLDNKIKESFGDKEMLLIKK